MKCSAMQTNTECSVVILFIVDSSLQTACSKHHTFYLLSTFILFSSITTALTLLALICLRTTISCFFLSIRSHRTIESSSWLSRIDSRDNLSATGSKYPLRVLPRFKSPVTKWSNLIKSRNLNTISILDAYTLNFGCAPKMYSKDVTWIFMILMLIRW